MAATLALAAVPGARAQVPQPVAPEFRISSTSTRWMWGAASDANGNFVLVWEGQQETTPASTDIHARRFDSSGTPLGEPFLVNSYTTGYQLLPAAAMDADGGFVVVWLSRDQDGERGGIYAQRFKPNGSPDGAEFLVNTTTTSDQSYPGVAMDADGDFVVVWDSQQGVDSGVFTDIYARRYSRSGVAQGDEFLVNTVVTGDQTQPAAAMNADGDFVLAWRGQGPEGLSSGLELQRYRADGTPVGGEVEVSTNTRAADENSPAVAMAADGSFIVAWDSRVPAIWPDPYNREVWVRRFSAAGDPLGAESVVSTYTTGPQLEPSIALDASGAFVVAWTSWVPEIGPTQDGSGTGVYAQWYSALAEPLGPEVPLATYTTGDQMYPVVAPTVGGDFVAGWAGGSGLEGPGAYARLFRVGTVAAETTPEGGLSLAVTPNPVGVSGARVRYAVSQGGGRRVSLYDVLGREVAVLVDGAAGAGEHEVELDVDRLVPGVYSVRLTAGTDVLTRRITVAR